MSNVFRKKIAEGPGARITSGEPEAGTSLPRGPERLTQPVVQRSYEIGSCAADLLSERLSGLTGALELRWVADHLFVADAGSEPASIPSTRTNGGSQ